MAVNVSYRTTTATNYRTLLDDIVTFVTNDQIDTVAVNAGGTGYAVDDIVTLSGGTFLVAATFKVAAVSSGVVTGLSVHNAGSYSVNTGATGIATTGGTGSGLTVDVTYQTPWSAERSLQQIGAVNATIVTGGTGYTVSDTLTVSGGTGTAATLTVTSVSSGVITGVDVATHGEYTVAPTNAVSVTGGTGSGATFNLTIEGDVGETQYLLKGIGSGSDEIFVGVRTYTDSGASAKNWELAGMTGFTLTGTWETQPNITPGRYDVSNDGGAYVPLDDDTITYWVNMTGRRIVIVAKVSTSYASVYLGFVDPMGTVAELPYPIVVIGNAPRSDTAFSSSRAALSGILNPIGKFITSGVIDTGPGFVRTGSGAWRSLQNWGESHQSTVFLSVQANNTIGPPGEQRRDGTVSDDTNWLVTGFDWGDVASPGGATPIYHIRPTDDSGGNLVPLFPPTVILSNTVERTAYGQLSGVKFAPIFDSGVNIEDTVTDENGATYIIFPEFNHSEPIQHFGLETR